MGKPPADKSSLCSPTPPEEPPFEWALAFLEAHHEQESAVSEAVESTVAGVFEVIRDHQLERIIYDHAAEVVTDDIARIYATVDIRYDRGHDKSLPPSSTGQLVQVRDFIPTATEGYSHSIAKPQPQLRPQLLRHKTGTLLPSAEPQPAPIDRWARGWVTARNANANDWNRFRDGGSADEWSEEGRSLRSQRSLSTGLQSSYRHVGHTRNRSHQHLQHDMEEQIGVPFPLAPEVREDQSLPPPIPMKRQPTRRGGCAGDKNGSRRGRNRTGGGGGGGGAGTKGSKSPESNHGQDEGAGDKDGKVDDVDSRIKELGGREWMIDASGEFLVIDRPQGDAMPKTVVSALYNFRDIQRKEDGELVPALGGASNDGAGDAAAGGGNVGGGDKRKSKSSGDIAFSKGTTPSNPVLRRVSRRRSSRRLGGRRSRSSSFFELEPTLQPNLTNSVDKPGPGVSVSDGDSHKEGPKWPQDPNHMSRSEYRQLQREQEFSDTNTFEGGEDVSTLGFSLGSVQSAPAMGTLGLGLNGGSGEADGGAGAVGCGGRRTMSGGGGSGRGTSISTFENVNPFAGGVRIPASTPRRGAREGGGDISPLSASVEGRSGVPFSGIGPESSSQEEEPDDPHLALVKDPGWGSIVRGSPKEAGYLPKVKQTSRERPLTHERPHTRNPRDPRHVPARENLHVSPKRRHNNDEIARISGGGSGGSVKSSSISFPSLHNPLTGWSRDGVSGGGIGTFPGTRGSPPASGMIKMTKPKDILVEGLLR